MRMAFFHDNVMLSGEQGEQYSIIFPYSLWKERYLPCFEEISVSTRVKPMSSVPEDKRGGFVKSSGERVVMRPVTAYRSMADALFHRGAIRAQVRDILEDADCAVIRLPSMLGFFACQEALRLKKPYAVELVASGFGSLWYVGKPGGKALAPFFWRQAKKYTSAADYVLYVTDGYLQRLYPSRGHTAAISDVCLDTPAPQVLKKRLARIGEHFANHTPLTFGLIGSLNVRYKGQKTAMKALSLLKEQLPGFRLKLLGPGNPAHFQSVAERLVIASQVEFCGTLPAGDAVAAWLDSLDVFLLPSDQEALPRALIEAMSRGCPAVGSAVGGVPELLEERYLHRRRDAKGLARCLERLLSDETRMRRAAEHNFQKAQSFSRETLDGARLEFYQAFARYAGGGILE